MDRLGNGLKILRGPVVWIWGLTKNVDETRKLKFCDEKQLYEANTTAFYRKTQAV